MPAPAHRRRARHHAVLASSPSGRWSLRTRPGRRAVAISNEAGPGAPVGSPIYDTATLGAGIDPTGTITFQLYGRWIRRARGRRRSPAVTVAGGGYYRSANYIPSVPGTYRWTATYSGDANDAAGRIGALRRGRRQRGQAAADAGRFGDRLGRGGRRPPPPASGVRRPTGTLAFKLYGPGNTTCAGTPVFTSSKAVAGNGSYSSAPFTATVGGTYQWVLTYGGDANNESVSTSCSDAANAVNLMAGVTLDRRPGGRAARRHGDGDVERDRQPVVDRLGRPLRPGRTGFGGPRLALHDRERPAAAPACKVPWLTLPGRLRGPSVRPEQLRPAGRARHGVEP